MPLTFYTTWFLACCFGIGLVTLDACEERTLPRFVIASVNIVRLAIWSAFCDIASNLIRGVVGIEPLPSSTNRPLIALGCGIWAYAIGISWWGDNRVYVGAGFGLLALAFLAIFVNAGRAKDLT